MKTHRLANRKTVYRIGSITKPFTAVMLMQLVAAGRVQLSDPVERYLPEVKQIAARPPGASSFTFLQLATMTAGLAREPDDAAPFWTGPVSAWEKKLLAALPHAHYTSLPGTEYLYSNIGYAILGAALARVAHEPYTEWQRTHVFRPLGMERTRFEVDPTIASDLAVGYEINSDGTVDDGTAAREARDGRGYKVPNGAIFTTVDDLTRFVAFELGRGPDSVVARSTLDDAFGGFVATDRFLETGYGLGFMARSRDGYSYVGHNGSVTGYHAAMYYDRVRKLGVVVFRNVGGGKQDPDRLAVDILSGLAAKQVAEIQSDIDKTRRQITQHAVPPNGIARTFLSFGQPYGGWLLVAFDSIPASQYGFHPTAVQQSIGFIAQHLETANYELCSTFGSEKRTMSAKDSLANTIKAGWPKDTLIARVRASLLFCAAAVNKLTDAQLADTLTIDTPGGKQTVLRVRYLMLLITDLAEHYSQLASYMRLLGLVPPSALMQPRK